MTGRGDDDLAAVLARSGLDPTAVRLAVLRALSGEGRAYPVADILATVRRAMPVNKVTLYRILDLFVEKGLANRHSCGDRALRYCLGPRFSGRAHGHAYCLRCGRMECLPGTEGLIDVEALGRRLSMEVVGVEVRIDGVCAACRGSGVDAGAGKN